MSAEPVVTSFYLESNLGGIPISVCDCGVLLFQPLASIHLARCPSSVITVNDVDITAK